MRCRPRADSGRGYAPPAAGARPALSPRNARRAGFRRGHETADNRDTLLGLYERGRILASEFRAGRKLLLVMEWRQGAHSPLGRVGGYLQRMAASTGVDEAPLWQLMQAIEADRFVPW